MSVESQAEPESSIEARAALAIAAFATRPLARACQATESEVEHWASGAELPNEEQAERLDVCLECFKLLGSRLNELSVVLWLGVPPPGGESPADKIRAGDFEAARRSAKFQRDRVQR